jgi:hypothetical protein
MNDIVDRAVLKAAVMREIFCPLSGVVLDVRRAVCFHASKDGKGASMVVDGKVFDDNNIAGVAAEQGVTLEVIDGRVINAPKSRKKKS